MEGGRGRGKVQPAGVSGIPGHVRATQVHDHKHQRVKGGREEGKVQKWRGLRQCSFDGCVGGSIEAFVRLSSSSFTGWMGEGAAGKLSAPRI